VCSEEEYWARIRAIPLIKEKDLGDGEAVLCRTIEGDPVRVTKPEFLGTFEKRAAAIEHYEAFFKRLPN
jgi:hypothetical protein